MANTGGYNVNGQDDGMPRNADLRKMRSAKAASDTPWANLTEDQKLARMEEARIAGQVADYLRTHKRPGTLHLEWDAFKALRHLPLSLPEPKEK